MKARMVQQAISQALQGDSGFSSTFDASKKKVIMDKAHSALFLSLGDKSLREISKETTAKGIWEKLETLYNVKTVASKLYLKQKLFSFKMSSDRSIFDQLDEFSKLCMDLEGAEITLTDDDKALILLYALPKSYGDFINVILFGKSDSLKFANVESALRTKEMQKKKHWCAR